MTTDDRDTESANPSKSFKVGEVDRLSGFFTPVWESKRRLRSESPIPSSAAASAPSSARGASSEKAAGSRPSVPPPAPSRRSTPPPARAAARPSRPPPAPGNAPLPDAELVVPEAEGSGALSSAPISASAAATPIAPATARAGDPGAADAAASSDKPSAHPAAAEQDTEPGAEAGGEPAGDALPDPRVAAALAGAAAVTVRPVIPMPTTPARVQQRSKAPSTPPPGAADAASKPAGPPHAPDALIEREPDLRSPPPAARAPLPAALQRSARAAAAAMHDRFIKARPHTESADTFARHRETESEREAAIAAAARAAAVPADPYPSHVLRSLRQTIHLSTPLPDAVRQMIEKYRY